jgi:hypothetical protein
MKWQAQFGMVLQSLGKKKKNRLFRVLHGSIRHIVVNASANTRAVKMTALWKTPKEFPTEPLITLRFINILTASITNMMKIK